MSQRLFVAVWPPAAASDAVAASVEAVAAQHGSLRWQSAHRWHLTLAFLGEGDADKAIGRLNRLLGEAGSSTRAPGRGEDLPRLESATGGIGAAGAAEPLRLAGAGTFGPVLWVGVEHGTWLADLARSVQGTLHVRDRRFRAHVTVARARGRPADAAAQVRAAVPALAEHRGPLWAPRAVTLVSSVNGPRPEYHVLADWPLPPGPATAESTR